MLRVMHAESLALAALALASLAFAQPSGTGGISGTVVLRGSNEPAGRVAVNLFWHGKPPSMALAITDASGAFAFDSLPAGRYSMRAFREGLGLGLLGDEGSAGEFLMLKEGERRTGLTIRLTLPASISGTVVDPDGEPLPGASVQIFTVAYPRGKRELVAVGGATTDFNGEYRAGGLQPGTYYVALDSPGQMLQAEGSPELGVFRRQYHGGATDWRRATPVVVASGREVEGIDIRAVLARAVRATGRVSGVPTAAPPEQTGTAPGQPAPASHVMIGLHGISEEVRGSVFSAAASAPEYGFEIPNVPPGHYRVFARFEGADTPALFARREVEIGEDSADASITLAPPVDLRGRVRYEGDPALRPKEFRVVLVSGEQGMFEAPKPAVVAADGTYTITAVPPGIWDINAGPIPRGGYLKSMHLGRQDVLTEEMEIGPGTRDGLNVVISSRGGRVDGELEGDAARVRPAIVMLAPTGSIAHVMSFFSFTESGPDGKFEIIGLTPGSYSLFAFDRIPQGDFRGPDVVEKMKALAHPIEIGEGQTVSVRVKPITSEMLKAVLR